MQGVRCSSKFNLKFNLRKVCRCWRLYQPNRKWTAIGRRCHCIGRRCVRRERLEYQHVDNVRTYTHSSPDTALKQSYARAADHDATFHSINNSLR